MPRSVKGSRPSDSRGASSKEPLDDLADEILEIADDSTDDWIEYRGKDGKTRRVFNLDNILRARLRIAARKRHLVGLMPNQPE